MKILVFLSIFLGFAGFTSAQVTSESAFTTAPAKVLPTLSPSERLDLLDYHREGIDRLIPTAMGDSARILSSTPSTITFSSGVGEKMTLGVLPQKSKQLIMVILTLETPSPDSSVEFFDHEWNKIPAVKLIKLPETDGWLRPGASKSEMAEWQKLVKFLTVEAEFDPDRMELTLSPTLGDYIDRDEMEKVQSMIIPAKRYKWTGTKFQPATR